MTGRCFDFFHEAHVLLLDISAWPGLLKTFINVSLDEVESESGRWVRAGWRVLMERPAVLWRTREILRKCANSTLSTSRGSSSQPLITLEGNVFWLKVSGEQAEEAGRHWRLFQVMQNKTEIETEVFVESEIESMSGIQSITWAQKAAIRWYPAISW